MKIKCTKFIYMNDNMDKIVVDCNSFYLKPNFKVSCFDKKDKKWKNFKCYDIYILDVKEGLVYFGF